MAMYVLAETNIANLTIVNHFFQLFPRWVLVGSKFSVQDAVGVLFKGDWP